MTSLQRRLIPMAAGAGWLLAMAWLLALGGAAVGWWRPGRQWPALMVLLFLSLVAAALASAWARWRRERMIREGPLPHFLKRKLREAYPRLTQKDAELVERGLRQFFVACLRSGDAFVAMPSKAADTMWHEFILHTRAYRDWCTLVLGRFLHHMPAEVLGASEKHNDGLRRAWFWACRDEAIDPRRPTRLPLLFALDTKLAIADGFLYEPDCGAPRRRQEDGASVGTGYVHCATSFGDADAASGDAASFGGCESSSGDGGGDGGGGGGGCGGGGD